MAEILVGLTNNKTSFWDPNTKTYLTLSNKTKKVVFNENDPAIGKHLERICHGLFASNKAITLYEGKIPQVAMDHWKAKFNLSGLNIAKNRADKINAASAEKEPQVVTQSVPKAAPVKVEAPVEETKAETPEVEAEVKATRKKPTTDK